MEANAKELKTEGVLLEWEAPARPFKARSQEFYRTVGALAFLIIVILFFVREFLLIGVIIATLFVMYVLSTVPPPKIRNRITRLGIQTAEHFHKWEELHNFWFDERYGSRMVIIRTLLPFPTHLQLLLSDANETQVKQLLSEKLPFQEKPERTFLDNAADWLSEKVPLERTS